MKQFSLWLIGLFAFTVISSSAHAQQVYGELKVVKGDVNIKSGRDSKVTKAAIGLRVFPTDTIVTGKDSRAKILMVDKNEINISPDSEIVLQKYVYDPANGKKEVLLNVLSGKVRAKVEQKYDGKAATFHVKTPSAVAGVRGTDFLTSFDSKTNQSSVVTFHGRVEFGQPGAGGTIQNPVMVTPGQVSVASAGAAPSTPVAMPKQQLASMEKESNADTASAAAPKDSASDSRQPSSSDEKKKEEGSKTDGAKTDDKKSEGNKDTAKNDGAKSEGTKSEGTKTEGAKTEGAKPEGAKTETAKGGGTTGGPGPSANTGNATGTTGSDKSPAAGSTSAVGAPTAATGERMPASVAPSVPGKSDMFRPSDLAGGGTTPIPVLGPALPVLPPTIPQTNIPACDFCNQTIQNGNSKLLINITHQ